MFATSRNRVLFLICLAFYLPAVGFRNLVLMAAPGSGKGTLSQYLVQKYGYIQICPGDLLRAEILAKTPLGEQIKPIVEKGEYIDEALTCALIHKHLLQAVEQGKPFIIDGFPRTLSSLQFLDQFFKEHNLMTKVCFVQLVAPDATCIQRIVGRQVCNHCFKVYNRQTARSQTLECCDHCQAPLALRLADTATIAAQRLQYFHTQIEPLFVQLVGYAKCTIATEQTLTALYQAYDALVLE